MPSEYCGLLCCGRWCQFPINPKPIGPPSESLRHPKNPNPRDDASPNSLVVGRFFEPGASQSEWCQKCQNAKLQVLMDFLTGNFWSNKMKIIFKTQLWKQVHLDQALKVFWYLDLVPWTLDSNKTLQKPENKRSRSVELFFVFSMFFSFIHYSTVNLNWTSETVDILTPGQWR